MIELNYYQFKHQLVKHVQIIITHTKKKREWSNRPGRILVDFNVHAGSDPYETLFSHSRGCGKSVGGESDALCMITPNFLHQLHYKSGDAIS